MLRFEPFRELRNEFGAERVRPFDDETIGFGFRKSERGRES
jgi:hypothetical protein